MTVDQAYKKYIENPSVEKAERMAKGDFTDGEIKEIAQGFRKGILGDGSSFMKCLLVSDSLSGLLDFYKIPNQLIKFYISYDKCKDLAGIGILEHFVIKIGDKILDPTADQFTGMPKVFFGKKPSWYLYETKHNTK